MYEKLVDVNYLEACIYSAFRKKKKTKSIKKILKNPMKHARKISQMIISGKLPFVKERNIKLIKDGKQKKPRSITKPSNYEHIVHHAVIGLLEEKLTNSAYKYSIASMPKRGDLYEKRHIQKWIRSFKGRKLYVLKLDIKKFFDTIDRQVLISKLGTVTKDKKLLDLLIKIIYYDASSTNRGVPIGYYTSQWFANFYLQSFDMFIKQHLRVKHYMRYMDDCVILLQNKRKLHKIFDAIATYLREHLELRVKENWQIFMLSYKPTKLMLQDGWKEDACYGRPLDFMGYKFYPWKTVIRKSTLRTLHRSVLKYLKNQIS